MFTVAVFSTSVSSGWKKVGYIIATLAALYMIVATLRLFIPELNAPSFDVFFGMGQFIFGLIVYGVGMAIPNVIAAQEKSQISKDPLSLYQNNWFLLIGVMVMLAVAAGLGFYGHYERSPALKETYCTEILEKTPDSAKTLILMANDKVKLDKLTEFLGDKWGLKTKNLIACVERSEQKM